MKPFNNIAVSPTQPENKADVWIKHNYIKYNGGWQNITYGTSGEVQSNSKRLASDKIKLEKGVYKLDNPNNEEISPVAIAKFNEDSFVELKANIKFPYELVIDDTFNQVSVVFKKANETVITSGDVKNFEILSLQEDDILVNDNGVYSSVLNKTEEYNIAEESAYINSKVVRWCKVKNGIAYVAIEFIPKNISMGTEGYKFFSGLPKPKASFQVSTLLYRGSDINLPIRFYLKTDGTLSYWYNPKLDLKTSYTFMLETSYPIE